jgi:prolyl oligopeptidase
MENQYSYVTNTGSKMLFRSNSDADRYRVVSIDIAAPDRDGKYSVKEVIAQSPTDVLESVDPCANNLLVLSYIHDVTSLCVIANMNGEIVHRIQLPSIGAIPVNYLYLQSCDI